MMLIFEHQSFMSPVASLFLTLLLALSIAALPQIRNSLITLPIARRIDTIINIFQQDQARVAALKGRSSNTLDRHAVSGQVINVAGGYVAKVGVGSPPTTCKSNLETKIRLPMDCLVQTTCLSTLVARTLGLAPILRT